MGTFDGQYISMKVDVEMPKTDSSVVEYELWYTSIYDLPKQLLYDLYEYEVAFNQTVKFHPRIVTL
jgi:hypothetical protein